MGIETISSVSSTPASASTEAAKAASLDYDTFLKLLIAQMNNQDPTDPMDSTEQIAQLATFSQVEQTIQTNANLETLIQSSKLSEAGTLIGKSVISADGLKSGVVDQVKIMSDGSVAILKDGTEVKIEAGITISDI